MKFATLVSSTMLAVCLIASTTSFAEDKLGDRKNPIKFAMVPSSDANKILASMSPIAKCLEKETGYFFEVSVPNSYIVVMEGFGSKKVDVAIPNTFGYVFAHEKYGVEALLVVKRDGETTYKSQIIVRADGKIKKLEDLNGKKFAFADPASLSGTILPKKYLKSKGIKIGEEVFAGQHTTVVTMVYQGQVDAGATYYNAPLKNEKGILEIKDARARVITQFPDVESKVLSLFHTDNIQNDPVAVRKDLPVEMKLKLKKAFTACVRKDDKELKGAFKAVNNADDFVDTKDSDYDEVRKMIKESGIDIEAQLKPKK